MRRFLFLLFLAGLAGPAIAAPPGTCPEDLARVDRSFEETMQRLEANGKSEVTAKCAAFRHHVAVMEAARTVFEACLDGFEERENVGQIVGTIADFEEIITANCPAE